MSPNSMNSSFDPLDQNATFYLPDGQTPFQLSIKEIQAVMDYSVLSCINYAAQLGSSLMLLIVLMLLTKGKKQYSPVFIVNVLALFFNSIRNILQIIYFTGPFMNFYVALTFYVDAVPRSQYISSVIGALVNLLTTALIELSLVLQTRVVCSTMRDVHQRIVLGVSIFITSMAVGWRLALTIMNIRMILNVVGFEDGLASTASAVNVTTTISIFFFCTIFTSKLAYAIIQRHRLGLNKFGPIQVLTIMGFQTMTIPAIFSILPYLTGIPNIASWVVSITCIFLPLSSLWASSIVPSSKDEGHAFAHNGQRSNSNASSSTSSTKKRFLFRNPFGSVYSGTSSLVSRGVRSWNEKIHSKTQSLQGIEVDISPTNSLKLGPGNMNQEVDLAEQGLCGIKGEQDYALDEKSKAGMKM